MSRITLAREFLSIDPSLTRVILRDAGPRIFPMLCDGQSAAAMRDLETIEVQVWTSGMVTRIDEDGVEIGDERVQPATVVWAEWVKAGMRGDAMGLVLCHISTICAPYCR